MASFKRYKQLVGSPSSSPAPTSIYIVPASVTSVITGLTVANTTVFELPVDIFIKSSSVDYYLAKGLRVPAGESIKLTGFEKMVIADGDDLQADGPTVDGGATPSFMVWASVYEDV